MEETINERIKRLRKATKLSQKQVAQLLGRQHSTYAQMERKGIIRAKDIIELSKIFDVDILLLLLGEEEAKNHYTKLNIEFQEKPKYEKQENDEKSDKNENGSKFILKGREENIIDVFRRLKEADKQKVYACVLNLFYKKEIF